MYLRILLAICLTALAEPTTSFAGKEWPTFQYAKNIQVEHFPTHRLFSIENTYRHSKERYQFALIPKTNRSTLPDLPEDTLVIYTPVDRVIAMTTTFIGFIDALDQQHRIIGVTEPQYINDPKIHQSLEAGRIQKVQAGATLDIERMLLLEPDLILATTVGAGSFQVQPRLARAGLPVVLSAEYMEESPLARAEWIKFIAAFFEADEKAEIVFHQIANRYQKLQAKTKEIQNRPTVFSGAPYAGAWYVPGGRSYIAQFIHDAGGDYLWKSDHTTGAIPLDFERVFRKAATADFWIDPSSYKNQQQLVKADQRFKKFHAFKTNRIFNNTRQMHPQRGNNIWERGIVHPEEVLADLMQIFHPELLPDRELIYYEPIK